VEFFGDGPLRQDLEARRDAIVKRQPDAKIVFHGFVSDPLKRMAGMTCTAVPSRIEPFGLVALEAQGVGVPVVGFTRSGVAEIVADGVTGSIVPHGDLPAMTKALLKILRDPKTAAEMGLAAQRRAREVFSLERHVGRLEELYCAKKCAGARG
jgi:glycosyltransferase involved in cell wall biosynthesis